MKSLKDRDLLEVYKIAIELRLDESFIVQLHRELERRGLSADAYRQQHQKRDDGDSLREQSERYFDYIMV